MFDPHDPEVSVETTRGDRPASSTGDRLMVGLAVLALVAGGVIGLTKLLPEDASAAKASPSPGPTSTQRPPPADDGGAPLRTLRLTGDPLPDIAPAERGRGRWARALRPVRILQARTQSAAEMGQLQAGDAMYVLDRPSGDTSRWLQVVAPLSGWVQTGAAGRPGIELFERHRLDEQVFPEAVFAGEGGQFLVAGLDNATVSSMLGATRGGNVWRRTDPPAGTDLVLAAWGPRQWLAVTVRNLVNGPQAWLWQSDDGSGWSSLGDLSSLIPPSGVGPMDFTASPAGYVMTPFHSGSGRGPRRVLFSRDGVTWVEREVPIRPDRVVASDIGFYAYATDPSERPVAGFSTNGSQWAEVDTSEMSRLIGVAGAGDQFVALDQIGDLVRSWSGRLEQGRLAWRRDPASEGAFAGSVVTSVSGGQTAIATGWAHATEQPLWWDLGPGGWQRHELPPSFGGLPRLAAASSQGYVVVGSGGGPLRQDPIMWATMRSAAMQPELRPFLARNAPIDLATCSQYSGDLLDMMMNSGVAYAECRGNGQIAVRGYVVLCQGCGPVSPADRNDASWLAQPDPRRILRLAPIHTGELGTLEAVLAPGINVNPAWANQWVDVVGHFDDPAATSCRISPETFGHEPYPGRAQVVRECRGRFVVTRVRLAKQGG